MRKKQKKMVFFPGLGLVLGLAAGCSSPAAGPADTAPRIVSLNPCADAILAQVAAPGQLLAISQYSHNPSSSSMPMDEAARFAAAGNTAEDVLALEPDLVVADMFLSPATRAALEDAGIRVESLAIATTLDASIDQVEQMAALAGQPARGQALAQTIRSAWQSAEFRGESVNTILWQPGGIVPGEDTLAAAMLEQSGFALHSAARGLGQGAYLPLEQVLADPPDLVLAAGDERMLTHPVMRKSETIAYRRFDPALLYCGGPTIVRALRRLRTIRAELG